MHIENIKRIHSNVVKHDYICPITIATNCKKRGAAIPTISPRLGKCIVCVDVADVACLGIELIGMV